MNCNNPLLSSQFTKETFFKKSISVLPKSINKIVVLEEKLSNEINNINAFLVDPAICMHIRMHNKILLCYEK